MLLCSRKCQQNNVKHISPEGAFGAALTGLPLPGCSELFSWGGARLGERLFQNQPLGLEQQELQWKQATEECICYQNT